MQTQHKKLQLRFRLHSTFTSLLFADEFGCVMCDVLYIYVYYCTLYMCLIYFCTMNEKSTNSIDQDE